MVTLRVRREPPPFERLRVRRTEFVSARLLRVTLSGTVEHLDPGSPAASVRLLLPRDGEADLTLPAWNGNEFLYADGARPTIRTYTPRNVDPAAGDLELDVVLHERGVAAAWAQAASVGDTAAVSGPGRGYAVDAEARRFVLVGDESAIPAISQLLEHLPADAAIHALVEVAHPDARHELPSHAGASVRWYDLPEGAPPGETVLTAVADLSLQVDVTMRVWAAGEAAAMQRLRRHLFDDLGLARAQAVVRGYWKTGRQGDDTVDD